MVSFRCLSCDVPVLDFLFWRPSVCLWISISEAPHGIPNSVTCFQVVIIDISFLLRLTRSGQGGGHKRALLFAELGGPAALLNLRHCHGYVGFASLATLLLRHVLEDDDTLHLCMDRVREKQNRIMPGRKCSSERIVCVMPYCAWVFSNSAETCRWSFATKYVAKCRRTLRHYANWTVDWTNKSHVKLVEKLAGVEFFCHTPENLLIRELCLYAVFFVCCRTC